MDDHLLRNDILVKLEQREDVWEYLDYFFSRLSDITGSEFELISGNQHYLEISTINDKPAFSQIHNLNLSNSSCFQVNVTSNLKVYNDEPKYGYHIIISGILKEFLSSIFITLDSLLSEANCIYSRLAIYLKNPSIEVYALHIYVNTFLELDTAEIIDILDGKFPEFDSVIWEGSLTPYIKKCFIFVSSQQIFSDCNVYIEEPRIIQELFSHSDFPLKTDLIELSKEVNIYGQFQVLVNRFDHLMTIEDFQLEFNLNLPGSSFIVIHLDEESFNFLPKAGFHWNATGRKIERKNLSLQKSLTRGYSNGMKYSCLKDPLKHKTSSSIPYSNREYLNANNGSYDTKDTELGRKSTPKIYSPIDSNLLDLFYMIGDSCGHSIDTDYGVELFRSIFFHFETRDTLLPLCKLLEKLGKIGPIHCLELKSGLNSLIGQIVIPRQINLSESFLQDNNLVLDKVYWQTIKKIAFDEHLSEIKENTNEKYEEKSSSSDSSALKSKNVQVPEKPIISYDKSIRYDENYEAETVPIIKESHLEKNYSVGNASSIGISGELDSITSARYLFSKGDQKGCKAVENNIIPHISTEDSSISKNPSVLKACTMDQYHEDIIKKCESSDLDPAVAISYASNRDIINNIDEIKSKDSIPQLNSLGEISKYGPSPLFSDLNERIHQKNMYNLKCDHLFNDNKDSSNNTSCIRCNNDSNTIQSDQNRRERPLLQFNSPDNTICVYAITVSCKHITWNILNLFFRSLYHSKLPFRFHVHQLASRFNGGIDALELYVIGNDSIMNNLKEKFESIKIFGVDISIQLDSKLRKFKRLALFDMDSTLIQHECIDEISKFEGLEQEVSQITTKAMNGELDFEASLRARVKLLQGIDIEKVFSHLIKNLNLTNGAIYIIKVLTKLGCETAVVSGGFVNASSKVREILGITWHYSNTLQVDHNGNSTGLLEPGALLVDAQMKAKILLDLATKGHIPLSTSMCIGDGANDLPMIKLAGLGVAFNAKPIVQKQAQYQINVADLIPILYLIGFTKNEADELILS